MFMHRRKWTTLRWQREVVEVKIELDKPPRAVAASFWACGSRFLRFLGKLHAPIEWFHGGPLDGGAMPPSHFPARILLPCRAPTMSLYLKSLLQACERIYIHRSGRATFLSNTDGTSRENQWGRTLIAESDRIAESSCWSSVM